MEGKSREEELEKRSTTPNTLCLLRVEVGAGTSQRAAALRLTASLASCCRLPACDVDLAEAQAGAVEGRAGVCVMQAFHLVALVEQRPGLKRDAQKLLMGLIVALLRMSDLEMVAGTHTAPLECGQLGLLASCILCSFNMRRDRGVVLAE